MTTWRIRIQGLGRYATELEIDARYAKWTAEMLILGEEIGMNGNLRKLALVLPTSAVLSVTPAPDGILSANPSIELESFPETADNANPDMKERAK